MNELIKQELETIKESVLEKVPATAIYLFGSHAYGEPNGDSDLDIYVIVPDKEMRNSEIHSEIFLDIHKKISKPIDLLLRDEQYFNYRLGAATLERKIYREGIKFYG